MAAPEPNTWKTVLSVAVFAPAVFLCPMVVILLGAVVLRRTVRPLADVERQLERYAAESSNGEARLDPIRVHSRVGIGWNRLVKIVGDDSRPNSLEGRLGEALETFRQNKQQQILNALADGVAVTDENGHITFANKAFAGLLGMEMAQLTSANESIEHSLSLESAGDAARPLLELSFRNRTVIVEVKRSGESSQGVLRVARSPLWSAEGDASGGHVWSVRDVTQQKLADQMRDQFVNTATHELRTPMTTIKALAEMLAESEVTDVDQQKMFCNTIHEEVTRLARFVDDLLQLSRMEVGSTPPRRQATDMERLLADVVEKVRPQLEQKNITFEIDVPAKLPELVVDKDKITVALVNLLGNAAKYTPEGGRVKFQVEVTDTGMRIAVQDTGIGIAAEELPKVFEKFYRASDAKVREQTGSGLGLSLTSEIVRLHGGKLTAQSEPDKGSTFTAVLPLAMEKVACSSA
ncbi:MAG: PAS domain-containing protein [Planctomycetes bacterium]|nr:PAS domain-containing protein [Planctomycetota bacterium]